MFEVKKWYGDVGKKCPNRIDFGFQPKFTNFDFPLVIALMIFLMLKKEY